MAVSADHALAVTHYYIVALHAQLYIEARAHDGGGSGSVDHHLELIEFLALELSGIDEGCRCDHRGAVLVVVHHRDVAFGLKSLLDAEAFRGLDVLKVDAAKCGRHCLYGIHQFVGILLVDFDVKAVKGSEYFEEQGLAFHHRLCGLGSNVAKAKHGSAIADDSHKVALIGISVSVGGVLFDFKTRIGHARRVSQAQVILRKVGFCGHYFDFARLRIFMVVERCFWCNFG